MSYVSIGQSLSVPRLLLGVIQLRSTFTYNYIYVFANYSAKCAVISFLCFYD